jgi:hypothetical protein
MKMSTLFRMSWFIIFLPSFAMILYQAFIEISFGIIKFLLQNNDRKAKTKVIVICFLNTLLTVSAGITLILLSIR